MKNFKINQSERNKPKKGITLIALVITIVVLLLLAAIVIHFSLGDNGIILKTKEANTKNTYSELIDNSKAEVTALALDKTIDDSLNFDIKEIYKRPFFVNNYEIVNDNIVKKDTTTPIISKTDYETILKPVFEDTENGDNPVVTPPSTTPITPPVTPPRTRNRKSYASTRKYSYYSKCFRKS